MQQPAVTIELCATRHDHSAVIFICVELYTEQQCVGRSESKNLNSNQRPIEGSGFSFQDLGGEAQGGDCPPSPHPPTFVSPDAVYLQPQVSSIKQCFGLIDENIELSHIHLATSHLNKML